MVMCRGPVNTKGDNMGDNSPDIINLLSDLEEGELEEISDVSSDEEMLLRQRIEILENYNSMLEKKYEREKSVCRDPIKLCRRKEKRLGHNKARHLKKRKKTVPIREHVSKHRRHKKRYSSSESDTEVYDKKILRDAIGISDKKVSQTSLKNRLFPIVKDNKILDKNDSSNENNSLLSVTEDLVDCKENINQPNDIFESTNGIKTVCDVSEDIVSTECENTVNNVDIETGDCDKQIVDEQLNVANIELPPDPDNCISEDDAELLRQLALNSKSNRRPTTKVVTDKIVHEKEEEIKDGDGSDSDITELRIIALRSAMLKKAMERKRQRKESRRRRNSKRVRMSVVFSDLEDNESYRSRNNNTDIEEVDMDVDHDSLHNNSNNIENDVSQDMMFSIDSQPYLTHTADQGYQYLYNDLQYYDSNNYIFQPIKQTDACNIDDYQGAVEMEDDLEEHEDVLRAKLLNAMSSSNSKNIQAEISVPSTSKVPIAKCDESNLIIRLGESDLESDCEETKQLIITNQKIQRETAFQRNLDMFLKSARSKVESTVLATPKRPVITCASPVVKKHTPVAVKHLPAADQQEYRQLVKRMSELQNLKMAKQQQAMINDIASKCNNDERDVAPLKQNEKIKRTAVDTMENYNRILKDGVQQEIIEKQKKLTKTIELHLELTRKKIINHTKMMKRLEAESSNLKLTCDHLKTQAQEIEIALRSTRMKLSDNQRLANNTNKNLSKLQKHEEILRNKIKNISMNLNKNVRSNVNRAADAYSTKITMKNKVINKKPNTTTDKITPQRKVLGGTSNKVDNFVKPITRTIVNNVATSVRKVVPSNDHKKDTVVATKSKGVVKTNLDHRKHNDKVESGVRTAEKLDKNRTEEASSNKNSKELNSVPVVNNLLKKIDNSDSLQPDKEMSSVVELEGLPIEKFCDKPDDVDRNGSTEPLNKKDCQISDLNGDGVKEVIKDVNTVEDRCSESVAITNNDNVVNTNLLEAPSLSKGEVESSDCNYVGESKTSANSDDVKTVDDTLEVSSEEQSRMQVDGSPEKEDRTETKHSISNAKLLHVKETMDNDYKSPLHVLKAKNTWSDDAQAIFCPFEVGGSCKDPDCKYFHPRTS